MGMYETASKKDIDELKIRLRKVENKQKPFWKKITRSLQNVSKP